MTVLSVNPVAVAASSSVPSPAATNRSHARSIRSKAPLMPNSTSSGHAKRDAPANTPNREGRDAPSTPHAPNHSNRAPALERYHISPGASTSAWLWRRDLDLLRALYRGQPGGFSVHIRAAVAVMCDHLRAELRKSPHGCALLSRLSQLDDTETPNAP